MNADAAGVAWRTDALRVAAVLSGAAGVVHLVVARDHVADELAHGVLFVGAGALQLAWAGAVWWRGERDRRLVAAGGLGLQLALVAAWAFARVFGVPGGEEPWQPEAVGPLDAQTAFDELVIAALALQALRGRRGRRLLADGLEALALLAIAATWLMLAAGAEHGH